MASVYEMARQKIAARAPIAVFQVEVKRKRHDLGETKEQRKTINDRWYAKNRFDKVEYMKKYQLDFKQKWGFYPAAWFYWKKKIKRKQITPGQLPKKYIQIFKDDKVNGRI